MYGSMAAPGTSHPDMSPFGPATLAAESGDSSPSSPSSRNSRTNPFRASFGCPGLSIDSPDLDLAVTFPAHHSLIAVTSSEESSVLG